MRIYFAIPPFFSLRTVIGGIFFLISKLRNSYRIVNQFVEIIASVSGQSLSIQKYSVFPNLNIQKTGSWHSMSFRAIGERSRKERK